MAVPDVQQGHELQGDARGLPPGAGQGIIPSALPEHSSVGRECDQEKVPVLASLKRGPW